jgi:hypothetical protein
LLSVANGSFTVAPFAFVQVFYAPLCHVNSEALQSPIGFFASAIQTDNASARGE